METKNNTGVLFKNEKTSDKQPDYKGTAVVDGVEKDVAIWVRTSQNGKQYFSMTIKEKFVKQENQSTKPSNDLPF